MSTVNIILDNYNNACFPGQTIAGRVECNFDKEETFRALRLKFRGRAKTEWSETRRDHHHGNTTSHHHHGSTTSHSHTVRYYGEEPYFDQEFILVQGGENFSLPAGKHTYPFSYILPAQLPSSFEGSYGNIRYYIKATVDRPWKFDYEQKLGLNLVSPLDLNYIPGLRDPIASSVEKTMCSCWCNNSGALTFNMSLPNSGFIPGQEVNIGAYVQNMSNVNVKNVKFKIIGELQYMAHYPSGGLRCDEFLVTESTDGPIGAHAEKSWTSTLKIPFEHLANLLPCSIINVRYLLQGKVVLPCPHSNLENIVQVSIGTEPLSAVPTSFPGGPPPQISYALPSGPTTAGTPLLQPLPAPYLAGGDAPYPLSGDTKYPPTASSYTPGGVSNGFENIKSPSAPPGGAPYASGGTPYPPGSVGIGAINPSAPNTVGGAPYPPSSISYSSPGAPLPSYEEARNLQEKSEKPE